MGTLASGGAGTCLARLGEAGPAFKGAFPGSVGPAFADGGHDLGELSVESVKLLSFGSARDEGV